MDFDWAQITYHSWHLLAAYAFALPVALAMPIRPVVQMLAAVAVATDRFEIAALLSVITFLTLSVGGWLKDKAHGRSDETE